MKRNKGKWILALVLAVVLVVGSVAGQFVLGLQPDLQVIDRTGVEDAVGNGDNGHEDDAAPADIPNQALLSQNVVLFSEAETDAINDAILSLESLESGVEMKIASGSAMKNMGVGDIFFLEGDETTPFGMTYIGKIASIIPGETADTYTLETPMMDEVFDILRFNADGVLSDENLVSVDCAPGVTMAEDSTLQAAATSQLLDLSSAASTPVADLSAADATPAKTVKGEATDKLMFNVTLDLAKILGLKKEPTADQEQVDFMQAGGVQVYIAASGDGKRYHRQGCSYLQQSKAITLENALKDGLTACSRCKPPLRKDDEGVANYDQKLELSGSFGIKQLTYSATCNWDILEGSGLQDLFFDVQGTFSAGLKLETDLEWEISGRTTQYKFSDDLCFEGLKERLFPLVALHYTVGASFVPVTGVGDAVNSQLRCLTNVPLSIVGIVYVDGHGKVSLGASAYFNFEKPFHYDKTIIRNGEFKWDKSFDIGETNITAGIDAELTADVDFQVGCGLDLYLFNLKVLQLDVAQVGVQASGEAKIQLTNETVKDAEENFSWNAFVRGYFKLLQLKIGVQAKAEILPFLDLSFDFERDFCLWEKELFKFGKPSETEFDEATMSYTHITAKDSGAKYYKDAGGNLVMDKDKNRTTLWSKPFFTICGIDKSFIYVLENNDDDTHDIRRIAKNGKTSKIVAEDVGFYLTMDKQYTYFVPDFDRSAIRRLDRETGVIDTLANFSRDVAHMAKQDDNFYVIIGETDFFGGFSGEYLLIGKDGQTIEEYGSRPEVKDLLMSEFENYSAAREIISSGYLRNTANAVYWYGPEGGFVDVRADVGWNPIEAGILTMEGYRNMVLYRAADGEKVPFVTVAHSHALFTVIQDKTGRFYYMDQTTTEMILYTLSPDRSEQAVLMRAPLTDFPVDLSECGVTEVDGTFYFYTITGNNTVCDVLYQYNIY